MFNDPNPTEGLPCGLEHIYDEPHSCLLVFPGPGAKPLRYLAHLGPSRSFSIKGTYYINRYTPIQVYMHIITLGSWHKTHKSIYCMIIWLKWAHAICVADLVTQQHKGDVLDPAPRMRDTGGIGMRLEVWAVDGKLVIEVSWDTCCINFVYHPVSFNSRESQCDTITFYSRKSQGF